MPPALIPNSWDPGSALLIVLNNRYESSANLFGQGHTIQYSYYLEGFDKGWSEWTRKPEKDYTNIPPGDYVFKVKCRNNFNNESAITSFHFSVLPPWYRTWWAYALYILIIAGVIALFLRLYNNFIREKHQRAFELLEHQKEKELYQNKIEGLRLRFPNQ